MYIFISSDIPNFPLKYFSTTWKQPCIPCNIKFVIFYLYILQNRGSRSDSLSSSAQQHVIIKNFQAHLIIDSRPAYVIIYQETSICPSSIFIPRRIVFQLLRGKHVICRRFHSILIQISTKIHVNTYNALKMYKTISDSFGSLQIEAINMNLHKINPTSD